MLLTGAARLMFEDETLEMKPGDFVNFPARRKHRVEWTPPDEPTIWLAAGRTRQKPQQTREIALQG